MDIFNKNLPRKVRCISTDTSYGMMVNSQYNSELELNKIYTVTQIDVDSWFTLVSLEGFKHRFNSVVFEELQ